MTRSFFEEAARARRIADDDETQGTALRRRDMIGDWRRLYPLMRWLLAIAICLVIVLALLIAFAT